MILYIFNTSSKKYITVKLKYTMFFTRNSGINVLESFPAISTGQSLYINLDIIVKNNNTIFINNTLLS